MRFELIDRVLEHDSDHLTAVKAVTTAEEYLADHFPGFPVLPGVMMLEVMVQASRRFVEAQAPSTDPDNDPNNNSAAPVWPLVLTDVRNVRYSNMVRPGQSLTVRVTLRKRDADGWEFAGKGTVDGQVAVQGRFRLNELRPMIAEANAPRSS